MTVKSEKKYWRSLDELQNTEEFQEFLHREFPVAASKFPEGVSRRRWMQLMGASLALGGLAGCRWEEEKIAPFVMRPENRIPGKTEFFATSIEIGGMPRHLLATSYDGRPIKIEGNAEHPASRGASDAFSQATILDLYDPDRADTVREKSGKKSFTRSWREFEAFVDSHFSDLRNSQGEGLRLLIEPTSSLSTRSMLAVFKKHFPKAVVHTYSSCSRENETEGAMLAFGKPLRTRLQLDSAKIIAAFDEDLLGVHPNALEQARGYGMGRTPGEGMSRIYVAESQYSSTGIAADHRLPIKSSDIGLLIAHVASLVRNAIDSTEQLPELPVIDEKAMAFASALAGDLVANRGKSVLAVGASQPAEVHSLVHSLNEILGNIGNTVTLTEDPLFAEDSESLPSLVTEMNAGNVETLLILGGNPVFKAPGELGFTKALEKVKTSIRLGMRNDETSRLCTWQLPEAHPFEAWGDVRGWDGTICTAQPLIAPLLKGKSSIEVLAILCGDIREPQNIVRDSISKALKRELDNAEWQKLLHDGLIADSSLPAQSITKISSDQCEQWIQQIADRPQSDKELVFVLGECVFDGRFANNGWLQETPDFLTKLTWDNAAIVSPKMAKSLSLEHGNVVKIKAGDNSIEIPVFVLPGQADGSVGVAVGYGRTAAGIVGGDSEAGVAPVGVDVNVLRKSGGSSFTSEFEITKTKKTHELATTQDHHAIDKVGLEETGRRVGELVREGTLDEYLHHPDFAQHMTHHPPLESLWEEPSHDGHAWGMSVDLNKCIGCNGCMVACQAENNVPIVGKDQVMRGREMHWIRLDRYFHGDEENPEVATQPVACQQCENAPCEQVCPVAATVHSDEGLNDMVYNRCIGTRYCANNCPYKVRRFNFLDYSADFEEPGRELVQLVVNPEVTVRSRGVMEKCTYCVQRIQNVKIDSKRENRSIKDGEVLTACQQACPTQAIEFGDLNDSSSRVALAHKDSRAYGMLSELNVKPRTKYLARIRNPNPLLETASTSPDPHHENNHGHS